MTTEQRFKNRRQLADCFIELAKRAAELDEPFIQCSAYVIAGTIVECSDDSFALLCASFAEKRLNDGDQKLDFP